MRRRVVVTGLGLVTPLGTGVRTAWSNLISGKSGIVSLKGRKHEETGASYEDMPSQVAGLVTRGTAEGEFELAKWVPKTDYSKTSPFMHFAYSATQQALDDANWHPTLKKDLERTGVCIGSGIGCIDDIATTAITFASKFPPSSSLAPLVNMAAGNISIRYGFQAKGAHSIGDAMRFIQYGDADVMVAGGTESSVSPLAMAGFLQSLSTSFASTPSASSRPFDIHRDGFVIGEGSGVFVLEEMEHAKARGATIYAELCGYGLTGDANHITSPPEDGNGAMRAIRRALEVASVREEEVGYVNAHATSTSLGDAAEARAILSSFPRSPTVSSTKGATGHLLGAAGSGIIPPTCNLQQPDGGAIGDLDHVMTTREKEVEVAVTNSFGFGGTNASLVFKKV
ncbi:thiolase-like protein [Chytridium lagenaria]|nr:thiolase-like protein [Chytridium lagenaria]